MIEVIQAHIDAMTLPDGVRVSAWLHDCGLIHVAVGSRCERALCVQGGTMEHCMQQAMPAWWPAETVIDAIAKQVALTVENVMWYHRRIASRWN